VAIFVHSAVAIVAVGTTKHITDPCFFEADEVTRMSLGLSQNTRFLDCFVHALWHKGGPVDVCGYVAGKKQLAFKKAGERALVAHANGQLIPTIPGRADLAALPNQTLADPFLVELYEIARRFAPIHRSERSAAQSSSLSGPDSDAQSSSAQTNEDDGEGASS
jgi:hypothetical protein